MIIEFTPKVKEDRALYYVIQTQSGKVSSFLRLSLSKNEQEAIAEARKTKKTDHEFSVVNSDSIVVYMENAKGKSLSLGNWYLPNIEVDWHNFSKVEWTEADRERYAYHKTLEFHRSSFVTMSSKYLPKLKSPKLIIDEVHYLK